MKPQTISLGLKIIGTKSSLIHQLVGLALVVSVSTSHMVGREFASRPGHALKRSPGINCKSRELYHGPGLLSSATWPLLPIKHYNRLIVINQTNWSILTWWIFIPMVLSVYVYVSVYTYMSVNMKPYLKQFQRPGMQLFTNKNIILFFVLEFMNLCPLYIQCICITISVELIRKLYHVHVHLNVAVMMCV